MKILKKVYKTIWYKTLYLSKKVSISKGCKVSCGSTLYGYNKIGKHSEFNGVIGKHSYIGENSKIYANIGKFCSIGNNVKVIYATHPSKKFVSTHPSLYSLRKQSGYTYTKFQRFDEFLYYDKEKSIVTKIENDVWIGDNVIILGGVSIGNGAIVAAGSIVTKNVEPYTIVGGIPAKKINDRFNSDQKNFLENFQWWEKNDDFILSNIDQFCDIEQFV